MAGRGSVYELCRRLNKKASDVQLNCIFCGGTLTDYDKFTFDVKALCLITRGGKGPYGACVRCCEFRAFADCVRNAQCTLELDGVERVTGKRSEDIVVRCMFCLGLLTNADKKLAKEKRKPFILVRKCWRGSCGACLCKQE